MEVDSYELYHIGSKLNPATDFNTLKSKLKEKLAAADYLVVNETQTDNTFFIRNPIEVLATKNTVRVEYNIAAQALNVVGTNVEGVQTVFKEVIDKLKDLEYEIENLIIVFEILSTVLIKVDDKPIDILNQSLSLDNNSFPVKDVQNWGISGIRLVGDNELRNTFFSAFIEPNPTSPNSRFRLKLQYRSKEKENIEEFSKDLNSKVLSLITQLG